jgi:hypothetical protein
MSNSACCHATGSVILGGMGILEVLWNSSYNKAIICIEVCTRDVGAAIAVLELLTMLARLVWRCDRALVEGCA